MQVSKSPGLYSNSLQYRNTFKPKPEAYAFLSEKGEIEIPQQGLETMDPNFLQNIETLAQLCWQQPQSRQLDIRETTYGNRSLVASKKTLRQERSTGHLSSRYLTTSPNKEKVMDSLSKIVNKSYAGSSECRHICKRIFRFYASIGSRLNMDSLKLTKFSRFCNEALITDAIINPRNLDTLFYKYSKNQGSINFEQFLLILVAIAVVQNPDLSKRDAFRLLFEGNIMPLYCQLYSQTDLGEYEAMFKEPIEKETCIVLRTIAPAFSQLFSHYFPGIKLGQSSKVDSCMQNFLREFNVCPFLLNFGIAQTVFGEVLNMGSAQLTDCLEISLEPGKDTGTGFTLTKFLLYIARLALVWGFQQYGEKVFNEDGAIVSKEILIKFLQIMEMSQGCARFKENVSASNHSSFSLLPKKIEDEQISSNDFKLTTCYSSNRDLRTSRKLFTSNPNQDFSSARQQDRSTDRVTHRNETSSPLKSSRARGISKENTAQVFEENANLLQAIFKTFCSFTGGEETSRIKTSSIIRLFKEADLIKGSTTIDRTAEHYQSKKTIRTEGLSYREGGKNRGLTTAELDTFLRELLSVNISRCNSSRSVDRHATSLKNLLTPQTPRQNDHFNVFLKAIEFVSARLFPDTEPKKAISFVIKYHLASVLEGRKLANRDIDIKADLNALVSLLKEPPVIDVLGKLKKAVHYFYKVYCRQGEVMSHEEFLNFCRNFKILPDILSRGKLIEVFFTLSSLCPLSRPQQEGVQEEDEEDQEVNNIEGLVIDENLFVEALALAASKIETSCSGSVMNKLLFIIEKVKEGMVLGNNRNIIQAIELVRSQKEITELINYIRSKYWNVIRSNGNEKQESNENFDDIFEEVKPQNKK